MSVLSLLSCVFILISSFFSFVSSQSPSPSIPDSPLNPPLEGFPGWANINGTSVFPGPQFINPSIVFGLLTAAFLLFMLYIGISCLMGVQRPVRMSSVPLALSKEY